MLLYVKFEDEVVILGNMDRRKFIKVGASAAIAASLSAQAVASGPCTGESDADVAGTAGGGKRRKKGTTLGPTSLNLVPITIHAGASAPIRMLHVSDSHLCLVTDNDNERKHKVAGSRINVFPKSLEYWNESIRFSKENDLVYVHTGDAIDFVSEGNLIAASNGFKELDAMACSGNHEFSQYIGEAREDEAYKKLSYNEVQKAFPNDLKVSSRVLNGVNFVAIDDVYYYVTEEIAQLVRKEFAKGLPVILLCHVPFYTPGLCVDSLKRNNGTCAYLTGAPIEITSTYQNNPDLPEDLQWKNRDIQQKADATTLAFQDWLRNQPLLKGILSGHLHHFYQETFSETAVQYVVGAGYDGDAYLVTVE